MAANIPSEYVALTQLANVLSVAEQDIRISWSRGGTIYAIGIAALGTDVSEESWTVFVFGHSAHSGEVKPTSILRLNNKAWSAYEISST